MRNLHTSAAALLSLIGMASCSPKAETSSASASAIDYATSYPNLYAAFSAKLNFSSLPTYAKQTVPGYITKDNTTTNTLTEEGALLGRILFYDKKLSSTNTVSCASCHVQARAFGDTRDLSVGANGFTARHAMRLVNARFGNERHFFWDERVATLEIQTTQPIQNNAEMGFSGVSGDSSIADLMTSLKTVGYYKDLFRLAYGVEDITEVKIQNALAQFVRSIQSFDSRYDQGRSVTGNDNANFPNFTSDENIGKTLFLRAPGQGGAGCAACHQPPEFSIDPNSLSNGVTGIFGSGATDTTVIRSPSLRNLFDPTGAANGNFMHDASLNGIDAVIEHYNSGISLTANLDNRLKPGGAAIRLNLTATQKLQLAAFLKTLSGTAVYTDTRWADPF